MPINKEELKKALREAASAEFRDISPDAEFEFSEQFSEKMKKLANGKKRIWQISSVTVKKWGTLAAAFLLGVLAALLPIAISNNDKPQGEVIIDLGFADGLSEIDSSNKSSSKPKKDKPKNSQIYVAPPTSSKETSTKPKEPSKEVESDLVGLEGETPIYEVTPDYLNPNQQEIPEDEILNINSTKNYAKLTESFLELASSADVIVRVRVNSAVSRLSEWDKIITETTPEVLEVYKGEYKGEPIYTNGGIMLYSDCSKNSVINGKLEAEAGFDPSNPPKYIREYIDGQYIPNIGEEYIFFLSYNDVDERYHPVYAYQGTFRVANGTVENKAIKNDTKLMADIAALFGLEIKGDELLTVPLEQFVLKIRE